MHSKVAKPPMTAWEVVTTVRSEAAKHCPPSWPIDGRFSIACPSMVTLGHDSAGSVVINLEALGALGICGQGRELQALLLAMATELAASSWSKGLEVILVGFDRVLGVCEPFLGWHGGQSSRLAFWRSQGFHVPQRVGWPETAMPGSLSL
jgi:hypothetical protein